MSSFASPKDLIFDNTFNYAPIGMSLVDINGHFVKVNPSLCHYLGYKEEELLQRTFQSLSHPDDLPESKLKLEKLIQGHIPSYQVEKRYIHKEGYILWAQLASFLVKDCSGHPRYLVSQVKDISDKKLADKLIQGNSHQYKEIVENSPVGVVLLKNGICVYANQTLVDIVKAESKEDLIGQAVINFVPSEDYHQTLKDGVTRTQLYCYDGTKIDIEVKAQSTTYVNIPVKHLIIRDITQQVKMENYLIHSEKLSVAGQLAAGIAHEIRNPLTAIKGFMQLLQSQNTAIPYLNVIFSEINRIDHILNELLITAKPQKLKLENHNLIPLISDIVTLMKAQANIFNIEIVESHPDVSTYINCDSNQIKQILINFIKNSIEAMPHGGKISIQLKNLIDGVHIIIQDNGPGIPEEHLSNIAEPFFTTKENGTGLGIMICKQIIENHKGTLFINNSNGGVRIDIKLPMEMRG